MKKLVLFAVAVILSLTGFSQERDNSIQDQIDFYLSQAKLDSARILIESNLKTYDETGATDLEYQLVKVLFMQSSYIEALDQSFSSLDKISNTQDRVKFNFMVGCIYSAISDRKKAIEYYDLVVENSSDKSLLVQTYLLLSQLHTDVEEDEQSGESLKKAFELTQTSDLDPKLVSHVSKQYNFHTGNYERCKAENLEVINDSTSFLNSKSYAYSMIGDCLMEQDSLVKAASIYDMFFDLTLDTKDPEQIKVAVKKLIEVHEKLGNEQQANSFHKIYNQVLGDSASFSVEKYRDLYNLEKEREFNSIKASNKKSFIWTLAILLVLALAGALIYKRNKSANNLKEEVPEDNSENKISVSDAEINKIRLAIEKLQKEDTYLNTNITRKKFCSDNGIKSERYLSHFINTEYDKSFSVFLNELRVQYAHDRLKADAKFRNYKIEEIAKESGFGSKKSFERAFVAKYSKTPFKFILNL